MGELLRGVRNLKLPAFRQDSFDIEEGLKRPGLDRGTALDHFNLHLLGDTGLPLTVVEGGRHTEQGAELVLVKVEHLDTAGGLLVLLEGLEAIAAVDRVVEQVD
jgi:hypothetical protein